jgi:CTD small phosphatase-like protein 2
MSEQVTSGSGFDSNSRQTDPAGDESRLRQPRLLFRPADRDSLFKGEVSGKTLFDSSDITQVASPSLLNGMWDWSCKHAVELDQFPLDPARVHTALRQSLRFLAATEIPIPGKLLPASGQQVLLPPATTDRLTLVLDLDETLIHCVKSPNVDRLSDVSPPDLCIRFSDGAVKGSVRFRPYTKVFLEVVSNLFEVVIFTASTQAYADTVLDTLDPQRKWITHRLYRNACTLSPSGGYFKDLSLLGRPMDRVVLVDNSPTSLAMQPDNGIPVRTWQDDTKDREMIDLIPVLHACRNAGKVRDFLRDKYKLGAFLRRLRSDDPASLALLRRYSEIQ